jgi:hypothetical protein
VVSKQGYKEVPRPWELNTEEESKGYDGKGPAKNLTGRNPEQIGFAPRYAVF